MKMKAFFFNAAIIVALLTNCCLNSAVAQSGKTKTSPDINDAADQIDFCDVVLPDVEKKLRDEANATCTTQTSCVECRDRATKMVLAATLVVQPENPDCKSATDIGTAPDAKSRGAGDSAVPLTFRPKLLQSPCFAGGTNLEVYIPGYDRSSHEFSYLWEVDGGKGGHLSSLQCACGKSAQVRVTQLATGQSVTLSAKLNSTCVGTSGK